MVQTTASNLSHWWGRHSLSPGRTDFWQIGPLKLWVEHQPYRITLFWSHSPLWLDAHVRSIPGSGDVGKPPVGSSTMTVAFGSDTRPDLTLSPALPDRPLVLRAPTPVSVLPGESVNLFVVSPLWMRLDLAEPLKPVHEVPTFRLSDTWFGPISSMGTLCYASLSPLYLDLREVPLRSHCAVTAITIRNAGTNALKLDRINVPFPRLSLFYSPKTGFWTDRLTLIRKEDDEMADIKLDRQPPPEASPTQFVSGPRLSTSEVNPTLRAFSKIFSDRSGT